MEKLSSQFSIGVIITVNLDVPEAVQEVDCHSILFGVSGIKIKEFIELLFLCTGCDRLE